MPDYNNLRKARATIIEMLNDRGFSVSKYMKEDYVNISLDEIEKQYKADNINLNIESANTIFWDDKVNLSKIGKIIKNIIKKNPILVILVFRDELTTSQLANIKQEFGDIEFNIFKINELLFNITKHHMVPQHVLLNETETKLIYSTYGLNLPLISNTDVVCRYYGGKNDQIFKIIRPNNIYYRKIATII
jgi:DNA-directed RNA polymerase I, II, and III subunit RPABC1